MDSLYRPSEHQRKFSLRRHEHSWFIISYYSVNQLRFDFLTCILVLFDCIMVPIKNSIGLEMLGDSAGQWIH